MTKPSDRPGISGLYQAAYASLFKKYPEVQQERIIEILEDVSMDEADAEATLDQMRQRRKPTLEPIVIMDDSGNDTDGPVKLKSNQPHPLDKASESDAESSEPPSKVRTQRRRLVPKKELPDSLSDIPDSDTDVSGSLSRGRSVADKRAARTKSETKVKSALPPTKVNRPRQIKSLGYVPESNEVPEDENLEVVGEDPSDKPGGDLPCRILDNFIFYDLANRNLPISMDEIGQEGFDITASGDVEPIYDDGVHPDDENDDDDDDDDDDDGELGAGGSSDGRSPGPSDSGLSVMAPKSKKTGGKLSSRQLSKQPQESKKSRSPKQRIRLSAIFYYQEQYLDSGLSAIWLRTTFAWYKLCRPHPQYEGIYTSIVQPIRMANLVIAWALNCPQDDYKAFVAALPQVSLRGVTQPGCSNFGGGKISGEGDHDGPESNRTYLSRYDYRHTCTERVLLNQIDFVCSEVEAWCEQSNDFEIIQTPILQEIFKRRFSEKIKPTRQGGRQRNEYDAHDSYRPSEESATRQVSRVQRAPKSKKGLPENGATVTPHINNIAKGLFKKNLVAIKTNHPDLPALVLNASETTVAQLDPELKVAAGNAAEASVVDDEMDPDGPADMVITADAPHAGFFMNNPVDLQFKDPMSDTHGLRGSLARKYYRELVAAFPSPSTSPASAQLSKDPLGGIESDSDCDSGSDAAGQLPKAFRRRVSLQNDSDHQPTVQQTVRIHDCVYVSALPELPDTKSRGRNNQRQLAPSSLRNDHPKIVRVTHMYYDTYKQQYNMHGRLLEYGRDTVLEEVASPHELFLTDECHTFNFKTDFRGLCSVHYCAPEETGKSLMAKFGITTGFFYRFWHDPQTGAYEDAERHTVPVDQWPTTSGYCPACAKRQYLQSTEKARWIIRDLPHSAGTMEKTPMPCLTYKEIDYHLGDFVYIIPNVRGVPYRIGQIVAFSPHNIYQRPPTSMAPLKPKSPIKINYLSDSDSDSDLKVIIEPSILMATISSPKPLFAQVKYALPHLPNDQLDPANKAIPRHVCIREYIRMDDVPIHQLPVSDRTFVTVDPSALRTKKPMLASRSNYAQTLDGTPEQSRVAISSGSTAEGDSLTPKASPGNGSPANALLRFPIKDSRHLFATSKYTNIEPSRLEGKCWVQHISHIDDLEAYKDDDTNAFYVEFENQRSATAYDPAAIPTGLRFSRLQPDQLTTCVSCQHTRAVRIQSRRQLLATAAQAMQAPVPQYTPQTHTKNLLRGLQDGQIIPHTIKKAKPLIALDIFSGCGGLTAGMEASGIVETKYAIEFMPSAALTFERNYPGATVYNQCANLLLARAIGQHMDGRELAPEQDFLGRRLPDMPAPGQVDFIYCGPPCQGFSGINRFPKADDIKNTLVTTSLSYVDFYRPRYFLLENVYGMVRFRLGGTQDSSAKIKDGIKMGVLKFIIRALTSMGYQTRFSVQQAGFHGLPQSRRRIFVWGARRGDFLPIFPQPITCFGKAQSSIISLPKNPAYATSRRTQEAAPHSAITVQDAISDLPAFEYVNPQCVYQVEGESPADLLQTDFRSTAVRVSQLKRSDSGTAIMSELATPRRGDNILSTPMPIPSSAANRYEESRLAENSIDGHNASNPWIDPMLQLLLRINFVSHSESVAEQARLTALEDVLIKSRFQFSLASPGSSRFLALNGTEAELDTAPLRPSSTLAPINRPILQWVVPKGGYVGIMDQPFQCPPLTQYQRERRYRAERLHNHVTRVFNDLTVERICRIPMVPGADHSGLPDKLKPWCLSAPESAAERHNGWKGLFGRLDFKGHFSTALTDIQPMGKAGTVIHPTQHRVLSMRECARAQGFPDQFVFHSETPEDVKAMHRQVGNAVPPPLANALSKELVNAILDRCLLAETHGFHSAGQPGIKLEEHDEANLASTVEAAFAVTHRHSVDPTYLYGVTPS
ncbi:hypothetical protein H4R33_005251 [Dimargaris cristalligena]|nr:hypothetical protein H4R33_005251 [Dimargaris cristalligena]